MPDLWAEQRKRLDVMAMSTQWDWSPHDRTAIRAALARLDRLEAENAERRTHEIALQSPAAPCT